MSVLLGESHLQVVLKLQAGHGGRIMGAVPVTGEQLLINQALADNEYALDAAEGLLVVFLVQQPAHVGCNAMRAGAILVV
jgi:hypothetical protein